MPLLCQNIPKKANTIIVTDTLSKEQYYTKINEVLFENGFGLQSSDKSMGSFTTNPKEFKNGSYKLNILATDKKVTIRGQWKWREWTTGPEEWDDIVFGGQNTSPMRRSWDAMQSITDQIPGKKEYLIK